MIKRFLSAMLAAAASISLVSPVIAQTYNGQPIQGSVVYVPAGTTIEAVLTSPIDSSIARLGDVFNARVVSPLYLGNQLVLPANATLEGVITAVDKGRLMGINGTMGLKLTVATTPDGVVFPLSATIATNQSMVAASQKAVVEDKDGNLKARSTKATVGTGAARTAAWAAGGTLLGICFAPIVAGSIGLGAVAGVAGGGAVGLGSNLWRRGKDVKLSSGTKLVFQLDQPMSLTAGLSSNPVGPTVAQR